MFGMAHSHFQFASQLEDNPSGAKENSPWPIFALLILGAMALSLMWFVGKGPIRVSRPRVRVEGTRVVLTSEAVNRTSAPVHLSVRLLLACVYPAARSRALGAAPQIEHQDLELTLEPRSKQTLICEFAIPDLSTSPKLTADVQVLQRE